MEYGGGISLIANWVSRPEDVGWNDGRDWEAGFNIGGLREGHRGLDEYLTWFSKDVCIGDEISMRLIETSRVDEPVAVKRKRRKKHEDNA